MRLLSHCTELERDGMRFFAARTGAKDVVSIEGSARGGRAYLPKELHMIPELAAGLLDAGTERRGKETLRTQLAARGASLSFRATADRIHFKASCLPGDAPFLFTLIAECLSVPLLDSAELKLEVARQLGDLRESAAETNDQAARGLARLLFDPRHLNYASSFPEDAARLRKAARKDLRAFERLLGRNGLVVAVTGDVEPDRILRSAARSFAALPEGVDKPKLTDNQRSPEARETFISIPDKASIDAFIGTPVPFTCYDERYVPFNVLTGMLGGGGIFTGYLMNTVRERDGLTYGIYARPYGFDSGAQGALRIWAAFAPHNFDHALKTTRAEIRTFFDTELTSERLQVQQAYLEGSYAIALSTSRGAAAMLHRIGREGKSISYLDEYPSLIRGVTLKAIRDVSTLIDPDAFALAAAGAFTKK